MPPGFLPCSHTHTDARSPGDISPVVRAQSVAVPLAIRNLERDRLRASVLLAYLRSAFITYHFHDGNREIVLEFGDNANAAAWVFDFLSMESR